MSQQPSAPHPALAAYRVVDGCLQIGGIALDRLAERIGTTPFYVYDRRLISERIGELRRHLPRSISVSYAIKANPMTAVVQHLAGLVDGFDVASALEMSVALDTTIPASRISFAGPGKTTAELSQAVAADIMVHLESANEMETVAAIAARTGRRPRVAIRVNPDFELKGSGMRMGGGAQQFGIDSEQVPQMLARLASLPLEFVGFHIFAGSQNLRADLIQSTQAKIFELAVALAARAPAPVRYLNIGGGFGIPYFPNDRPLDLAAVGANLARLMAEVVPAGLPDAEVVVELGRYIVGEAGLYVTRVVDRKISRNQVFLITDGGMHHHLAASGNFGQVIRRNYPVAIGTRMAEPAREVANVVGCLCTPLDLLADKVELPSAEIGDLIVIFQSGAYGASASPAGFLSHPPAPEVLV